MVSPNFEFKIKRAILSVRVICFDCTEGQTLIIIQTFALKNYTCIFLTSKGKQTISFFSEKSYIMNFKILLSFEYSLTCITFRSFLSGIKQWYFCVFSMALAA